MTLKNLIFIIATALFLQSCIANKPAGNRKTVSSSVKATGSTTTGPVFLADETLYWFSTSKVTGTMTVNQNSDIVTYLRGSIVHNFLTSKDSSSVEYYRKTYCVVGTYPGTNKELRLRAVPIYITNYSNNTIERIFRLDVPSRAENAAACGLATISYSGASVITTPVNAATTAYALTEVCSGAGCTSGALITSTALKLYTSNVTAGTLTPVPTTQITLSSIALKIDLASNSTSGNSSCSNSSCESKGFDCCIEGQCVKDASQKANASLDPQYAQALSDYASNPLSFINYPNIYNICTNIAHTPPATSPGTTPFPTAAERLNAFLADYKCVNQTVTTGSYSLCLPSASESQYLATKKKLTISCGCPASYDDATRAINCPNWGVRPVYNSAVQTYANIIDFTCYTPTNVSAAQERVNTYLTDYTCIDKVLTTGSYSLCLPGASESQFLSIKKKLAIACGCPAGYDDATRAIKCPDWGVKPLYKSSVETISNIVDFYCYAPTPANPIGTITNLNVTVSSRSAPHRFYSTGGTNYDDLKGVSSTVVQEGDDFYYLDEINKASPVNGSFNINSVLGRMNVGLSQTQPAKMVGVELGKTYILSTTSGYFTPCSKCAKDSWFQTFTSHPSTAGGNGLRASGFTTARDTYSANSTLGNYEDTKFGRACYLPATMIPFSHKKELSLQAQRKNRLKTQAAYYINGYQRDWYGFNKGAMIGSFDGVTWFAIGSGRRITATTTKLYLAYNSSFLDLADRTDTIVNIIPDLSSNTAPDFDYDPELGITDKSQNMAGTCQKYHQCETDTDCVTQLGWEYSCADISQLKSTWPIYDTDSNEFANQEKSATLFEILGATTSQGSSGKRCVYRGAGAPCVRDYTALNANFNQKALTCAPNFYCAALTANKFNDELVRSPNEFDDIFFGMDTNVLGRPLNYVTASRTLTTDIITNIKYNGSAAMGLSAAQVDDMGICRPGKSLSTIAANAHANPDSAKRTDYINQIASCDSTATGLARTSSCPIITPEGDIAPYNYVPTNVALSVSRLRAMQNSCGAEAKHSSTLLSAFSNIEGGSLALLRNITSPVLAADACMRRAGSVCFTDLDCGPNRLHAEAVGSLSLTYFGGTQAEQNYWQESLICGQGAATPALGSANYNSYALNQNRCCREVGKDFTMFTSGPATIVPENMGTNVNLETSRFSVADPKAANRYSRYTASETAHTNASAIPSVNTNVTPAKNQWRVINETGSLNCCGGGWVRKFADGTHDWTVKNRLSLETSNFQCLNYRSPLVSPGYNGFGNTLDKIVKSTYQREYEYFCKSPSQNGCMQILYRDINGYSILPPLEYDPKNNLERDTDATLFNPSWVASQPLIYSGAPYLDLPVSKSSRLDTGPVGDLDSGNYSFRLNQDVPYQPFPYTFTQYPYDLYTFPDGSKGSLTFFADQDTDYGVSMYLPAYITYDTTTKVSGIDRIYIKYFYSDNRIETVDITSRQVSAALCDGVANFSVPPPPGQSMPIDALLAGNYEAWCVSHNPKTQNRPMLNVKAYNGADGSRQWEYAAVVIDFRPLETIKNIKTATPGNAYYYLTKLGRLELIGIPQITYEPIYCNDNQNNLVPGIFNNSVTTPVPPTTTTQRERFEANTPTYSGFEPIASYDEDLTSELEGNPSIGNQTKHFTFQDKLSHAAVFSSKDFTCCTPLGKETSTAAKCCSGFATTTSGKMTCKLPVGADLNVYFNKFVSSDGVGEDQPAGGLLLSTSATIGDENLSDFNEYTGEPKLRASTFLKLEALGAAYCANGKVGNGGSFGQFPPEPYSGYVVPSGTTTFSYPISIVDSIIDAEVTGNNAGKFPFDNGFRWDHHYYCK